MPHIEINREEFEELLGREVTDQELQENASLLGAHWNHVEGKKWDVEVYPNRPDLLSVEGLARAYRGFFDVEKGRENYEVEEGEIEMKVESSVEEVRPYIANAVVRDVELSDRIINGLVQLQEKLDQTMGRRRDKLAIGFHDLDPLEPPFTYTALEEGDQRFVPLGHEIEMMVSEVLEKHEKGEEYSWILEDEERYPVLIDSQDRIFSFPPITNSQLTEVTPDTTDIFIDITGKDKETVQEALRIITTSLSERGGTVESVEVDGESMPDLSPSDKHLEPEYFREISGIDLIGQRIAEKLEMMKFGAEVNEETQLVDVEVPCYRTDIMHQYDLIEDAVIAHRYREINPEMPEVDQIAERLPLEKFTDELRDAIIGAGAAEAHTYILSSKEKLFDHMDKGREDIAEMSNALTEDYTVARNWLLPSLMQVLKNNRHRTHPQRLFEVADVVQLDDSSRTGATNRRKLAFIHADSEADYTDAKEVLQHLERYLGMTFEVKAKEKEFLETGRSAEIYIEDKKVGFIGEISENVGGNWGLETKVSGFELDVEDIFNRK